MSSPGGGAILCVNCGSSSVKVALLAADGAPRLAEAAVESIGSGAARGWARAPGGAAPLARELGSIEAATAVSVALDLLSEAAREAPVAVAHRVVHGGDRHLEATPIDDRVVADLESVTALAPLHQPAALAGIRVARARWPSLPQVACFDTAFHAGLPEVARRFPLPASVTGPEVRRYGFHGLSYAHVMRILGQPPPARLVIAHLGGGSSLVAVAAGRPVDTTMGLTPTGGVPMGTRTGDLDPGLLFYLARRHGLSIDALEQLCDREAGLRGLGGTADMRALLAAAPRDPAAALAIAVFATGVRKAIGAYAAVLGGLDVLVFTGGVGAHAPAIRAAVCRDLAFLGVELDPAANERGGPEIGTPGAGATRVLAMPADEEREMARQTRARLALSDPGR